ncbi:hypothetical protein CAEBREN_20030 [Caenorhabditis brenneri]|uniref:Protein kinase domain-containing protein n=1 Tax=Caenorhabditis brenneri TaxID=135651 RepID=G0PBT1_CAEBE|nr:hypothetical protein CAEBREN_20030 [Caenorhabditis brenneri]
MKLLQLLIALLTVFSTQINTETVSISVFGPCQNRCIKKFGEIQEQVTNIDTWYREFKVNDTDFSLCRLGCNHPEFSPLNLPEFIYGQLAYQEIASKTTDFDRENVVKSVDVLCLEKSETFENELFGKVVMVLEDGVNPLENVHLIEVIAMDLAIDDDDSVIFRDWCYSPYCNISFNAFSHAEFRIRVSTFDDYGYIGRPIVSRWYDIQAFFSISSNKMNLKNIEWNQDKAAARFGFLPATNVYIPVCSFQIEHKKVLSSESKVIDFYLDHTREILVKNLSFNQNYTMNLVGDSSDPLEVNVPNCDILVGDVAMCAPPAVSAITSHWNTSSAFDSRLIIDWNYYSVLDASIDASNANAIRTSHFQFSVHPLITPNNDKCEKYDSIRRDVPFTYRKFMFNVPDAKCNYEVEVSVFDTKRRKSESKKIKIIRINQPSFMALLPSSDLQTTIGLIVILLFLILSFFLILIYCFLKRRNRSQNSKEMRKGTVVYAYVDEVTRDIMGVRPTGGRYVPSGKTARDLEQALVHPHSFNFTDGNKGGMFHNAFTNQLQYSLPSDSITPRPYGDIGSENPYDYIMDFHVESELSDDVFEEDICLSTPSPSIRDLPSVSPMPLIAPFDDFDTLPAYAHRNFRFGNSYEMEGNTMCRMKTAVDVLRGHCFTLKYPRDYSDECRQALRKELEILRTLPAHPNCVRFDGVVIGRWDNIPYQIIGILLEDCRGGSLHNYINIVGSVLRRGGMRTPEDPVAPLTDGSPLSSGYESFVSKADKGKQTPDGQSDTERVSNAFCRFAEQISGALEHVHRAGIVHTRVSPLHVYLSFDYNDPFDEVLSNQIVKLGDFGNSSRNLNEVIVDSTMPQPPEVINGKNYESKGDIWQFGVFLVEMSSLGVSYQVRKDIPKSGVTEFDTLPSTSLLRETARKCLKLRSRPTATELCNIFTEKNL